MTVEQRKLEKDLCRCCHAEGSFKNLGISWYNPLGEEEIYSNMLREQLGLDIYPVSGLLSEVTYKICDPCIVRLRDATDFRKQVQTCEAKFSDLISKNVFQVAVPFVADVKVEMEEDIFEGMKAEDDDADDGFEPTNFDDDEDNKDEVQTLLQLKQETKKGKGKGKATAKTKAKPVAAKAKKATAKATAKATKAKKAIKEETDAMIMELPAASGEAEKKKKGNTPVEAYLQNIIRAKGKKLDRRIYLCLQCGHVLSDRYGMREHVQFLHLPKECEICSKKFNNEKERTEHLREEHNKEIKCDKCGKKFTKKSNLKVHVRTVHVGRKCPHCDISVVDRDRAKHLHEVHGVNVPTCGICGYQVRLKGRLIRHQRTVHMKEKYVSCDQCDLKFYDSAHLKMHQVAHNSERKFECDFCQKKFQRKQTLIQHIMIHTGEKNKVCVVCGEKFVQKASLNYHMARHHPGQKCV